MKKLVRPLAAGAGLTGAMAAFNRSVRTARPRQRVGRRRAPLELARARHLRHRNRQRFAGCARPWHLCRRVVVRVPQTLRTARRAPSRHGDRPARLRALGSPEPRLFGRTVHRTDRRRADGIRRRRAGDVDRLLARRGVCDSRRRAHQPARRAPRHDLPDRLGRHPRPRPNGAQRAVDRPRSACR